MEYDVSSRQGLGSAGEELAAELLARQGYRILARNWRTRYGELDIIAYRNGVLVVCEVKTRRNGRFGGSLAAVTPIKLARARRLVNLWLLSQRPVDVRIDSIRFDVVGIDYDSGRQRIRHLAGVQA